MPATHELDCEAEHEVSVAQVYAFTTEPFQGNPAAVARLSPAQFRSKNAPQWMQRVARENNLSETAFIATRKLTGGGNNVVELDLKRFTTGKAHATLATAVVLVDAGRVLPSQTIHFHTLSGMLVIRFEPVDSSASSTGTNVRHLVTVDFPIVELKPLPPTNAFSLDETAAALGIPRAGVRDTFIVGPQMLVHVDSQSFASLGPDFPRLAKVDCRGVSVTTQVEDGDLVDADFRSRFFAPSIGINEDPVTGSVHCALAPFWSAKLGGRRQLRGLQSSPARGGFLAVELPETTPDRVLLKGEGVVVLRGSLLSSPQPTNL